MGGNPSDLLSGAAQARTSAEGARGMPLRTFASRMPEVAVALQETWARLWWASPRATPFQHPAWVLPWMREFGRRPLTLTARRGHRLVGLMVLDLPDDGLAVGQWAGAGISDYGDALIEPGEEGEVAPALLQRLEEECPALVMQLRQVPGDSPLVSAAAGPMQADEPTLALELPTRAGELARWVPRKMAANLRYYRRKLERVGPIRVVRAGAVDVDEVLDLFVALHQARWRSRGGDGVLDEDLVRFHRRVARRASESGLLALSALFVGDRAAAAAYGFQSKETAFFYLSGLDPELERLSPGTVLLGNWMEQAVADGVRRFDFLRGDENYKALWGARPQPTWSINVGGGAAFGEPAADRVQELPLASGDDLGADAP
jgi:CelD/BcsL family acetyltransferase involved in cellulose biosynthesis